MTVQGHSRSSVSMWMKSHWGTTHSGIIILVSCMKLRKIIL